MCQDWIYFLTRLGTLLVRNTFGSEHFWLGTLLARTIGGKSSKNLLSPKSCIKKVMASLWIISM